MALDFLLNKVKDAISQHADDQQHTGFDPSGLLSQVEGLFGQHAEQTGQPLPSVRPASEDPYGDPADQQQGILPASRDPYGDPADEADRARGIRPASED